MSSLNSVILIGRVGKDPEIKTTTGGTKVANFSLATTEKYKDKEDTQWHNLIIFGNIADVCEKYVKKGSLLSVQGKVVYRSWDNPDGTKAYKTEIVCDKLVLLGSKSDSSKEPTRDFDSGNQLSMPMSHAAEDDLPF